MHNLLEVMISVAFRNGVVTVDINGDGLGDTDTIRNLYLGSFAESPSD